MAAAVKTKTKSSKVSTDANIVIDLGNSETRVIVQSGSEQRMVTLPNRFAEVESIEVVPKNYHAAEDHEDRTYTFEVEGHTYTAGRFPDMEMSDREERPSSLEKKHESHLTDLMLNMAFSAAYEELAEIHDTKEANLDIEWNVVVLVSPSDIDYGQEDMIEKVRGIKKLQFHLPEREQEIVVSKVLVLPESFCSFLGVMFTQSGRPRKEYAELNETTTLIIDIGAGTTDFCLIRDGEAIDQMKDSVTVGGNNVVQLVRKDLRHQGMIFTEQEIQKAIISGVVKDGSKEISIVEELNRAKESVSRSIISAIRDYFEFSSYPIRSIENLLVVGGGALNTVEGAKPVAEFLVQYMHSLSPNVELVQLPTEKVKTSDGETVKAPVSPRHLNVLGAAVLARQQF